MKPINLPQINELNGYLKCLARLSLRRCFFGALAFESELEVDEFCTALASKWSEGNEYVAPVEHTFLGSSLIDSHGLFSDIERIIFRGALNKKALAKEETLEYLVKMLTEDINEYFGLLSTSIDTEGEFHPLLSGGVYNLDFECSKYSDSFHFIKRIDKYYVLTYFNKLAET